MPVKYTQKRIDSRLITTETSEPAANVRKGLAERKAARGGYMSTDRLELRNRIANFQIGAISL